MTLLCATFWRSLHCRSVWLGGRAVGLRLRKCLPGWAGLGLKTYQAWWAGFGFFTFPAWWAGFGLGVCAAKNLRKHARAALACLTGFCGHAPFYNFFIAHPLPQSLQGVAGAPLKTEYRRLNIQKPERANTANPWRSRNGAVELFWHVLGAKYGPSQHGICASSY